MDCRVHVDCLRPASATPHCQSGLSRAADCVAASIRAMHSSRVFKAIGTGIGASSPQGGAASAGLLRRRVMGQDGLRVFVCEDDPDWVEAGRLWAALTSPHLTSSHLFEA